MKKLLLLTLLLFNVVNVNSQKRKFGKITKKELKESYCSFDSIAEAAYLHKYKEVFFEYDQNAGFQKHVKFHQIIKIYNEKGFDLANQSIKYIHRDNGDEDEFYRIKATTYNLVNNKIEETDVDKKDILIDKNNEFYSYKKIAFPNVKKGSIIELQFELISDYWSISDVKIQEEIPVKFLHHSTTIPEYIVYKKSSMGYMSLQPQTKTKYNKIYFGHGSNQETVDYTEEYTLFTGENIKALRNDEPFTSGYKDFVGRVGYELSYTKFPNSTIKRYSTTWESVCAKLYEYRDFGAQLKKSSYFSDDLEKAIANEQEEISIINAAFNLVKSKVAWNDYVGIYTDQGVKKAYENGTGNVAEINLMLVAMLRKAGLNSNPVLLSTKSNGTTLFPTLEGLNYVIAAVETKDYGRILLDATSVYHPINFLPSRALNWEGRLLYNKGQTFSVPLSKAPKSQEQYMLNVTFNEDFGINAKLQSKFVDREAYGFRKKYISLSEEKFKEEINSDYDVNVLSYDVKNKYDLSQPIIFNAELEAKDLCDIINDKVYINPMLFFQKTENPFTLEKRKYPVDLIAPHKEMNTIIINIPKGYKVASLPQGLIANMTNNLGSYKYLIKQTGSIITLMTIKEFNTNMIVPTQYNELKGLYSEMIEKNKEKIVLEKI